MAVANELDWLSPDEITTAIRQQSGDTTATLIVWTWHRLVGGGEALGVWRLVGNAIVHGGVREWSIVLKGWAAWGGSEGEDDPTAFNWPRREMELYRSGLLADLPGDIRAPACYGSFHGEDGSTWVWLEDITDGVNGLETFDDYAMVARRLGQLNGAWATGRPLPEHPALSDSWTRRWVEAAGPSMDRLAQTADEPLVRQMFPPAVADAFRRIWETRHASYALMERVPRTFAHLDVFSRNIFIRDGHGAAAGAEVVLIDWSFSGIARLGEELGPLVMASAIFHDTPLETLDDLQDLVLDAYIEGLRDAGWRGDPGPVIDAYRVSAALRYGSGLVRVALPTLLGDWPRADLEQMLGLPFEETIAHLSAFRAWLARQIREHEDLFRS